MAARKRTRRRSTKRSNRTLWGRPSPNKHPKHLTKRQKAKAKRAAKRAGRPYPNAVDNVNAARS